MTSDNEQLHRTNSTPGTTTLRGPVRARGQGASERRRTDVRSLKGMLLAAIASGLLALGVIAAGWGPVLQREAGLVCLGVVSFVVGGVLAVLES